jgi:hypothetical protein
MLHEYDLISFKRNQNQLPSSIAPQLPSFDSVINLSSERTLIIQPVTQSEVSIEFMANGVLSRKVVKRSNFKTTYKVPAKKHTGSGMVQCESQIEVDALHVLQANAHVETIQEQPAVITYFDEFGKKRIHYPDFLVKLTNSNILILEIKSDKDSNDPQILWRTKHLHQNLKPLGITYLLVSRSQIPTTKSRKQLQLQGAA